MIGTLKHFPGHGSVTVDSHQALPVLGKSLAELRRTDLVPFRRGIAAGASAVMVGHLDVRAVDPGVPSSLSRLVVDGLLRDELGFRGLVLTDSLSMGAVTERYGPAKAAVRAVNAGVDVVLMPADAGAARDGIVAAVRDRRMLSSRLDEAAARMIALMLHVAHADAEPLGLGSSWRVSGQLSAAALTSVAGPCSGRARGRARPRRRPGRRRGDVPGRRAATGALGRQARRTHRPAPGPRRRPATAGRCRRRPRPAGRADAHRRTRPARDVRRDARRHGRTGGLPRRGPNRARTAAGESVRDTANRLLNARLSPGSTQT